MNIIRNAQLILLTLLMVGSLNAQESTVINVDVIGNISPEISLYEIKGGDIVKISTTNNSIYNKFSFKFYSDQPGLYAIGSSNANSNTINSYYTFYVKGNDIINLVYESGSYRLMGKNTKEAQDIERVNRLYANLRDYASNSDKTHFNDVFKELQDVSNQAKTLKPTSKDQHLMHTFEVYKDWYLTMLALSYKYKPKVSGQHPSDADFPSFYANIDHKKYLNDDILLMPFGNRMLGSLILDAANAINFKGSREQRRHSMIELIPSDLIRGQYITNEIQYVNSYDEYARIMSAYGQYISSPLQKDKVEKKLITLANSVPGSPYIDFKYANLKGELISKSSLKGKLIVLDFWATWCGPCKQEEPFFEKLAEEFQGKDVVFVAISTDKDKSAWEKYVQAKEGHFKGIHLHAGPGNALTQAYQITGIPRYMMLDKQGNIITINAPRPSTEGMKKMIKENL